MLQSFFLFLASASDRQLAKYVEYLKAENRILRERLPRQIRLTPRERNRLVRLGRKLGPAIKDLIGIVSPRTFLRWLNGPSERIATRKPGRPRTPASTKDLILRIASETGWGYTRILGELKKLGIGTVSRTTVRNILRDAGIDPGPKRGEGTWSEFVKRHAKTLWACDFFSTKIWTLRGRFDVFVLFFINLESRRVRVGGMTTNPDRVWMVQQARNASMALTDESARILIRDYDAKFVREFDAIVQAGGVRIKKIGPMAPNLNAIAERWVQTIRQECLDHFVIAGMGHLQHLIDEFVRHYETERPHQGRGNRLLTGADPPEPLDRARGIIRRDRLGGLLKHYFRRAA